LAAITLSFQVTNRLQPWRIPRGDVNGAGSLLVPIQAKVEEFFVDFDQFPCQAAARSTPPASISVCCSSRQP
jgi:hypothetical protein